MKFLLTNIMQYSGNINIVESQIFTISEWIGIGLIAFYVVLNDNYIHFGVV